MSFKHRVWDLPTRVFHWALALSVIGLFISGNVGGNAMVWHMRLGYLVASLLLFRVIWGFVGGYWSRFAQLRLAPRALLAYVRGQSGDLPRDHLGHSPSGSWSVVALLCLLCAQVTAGLFSDDDIFTAGPLAAHASSKLVSSATFYHTGPGKLAVVLLVVAHVGAIWFYAKKKRRNLVPAMLHGDHKGVVAVNAPASADGLAHAVFGLLVWLLCAGAVAWMVNTYG